MELLLVDKVMYDVFTGVDNHLTNTFLLFMHSNAFNIFSLFTDIVMSTHRISSFLFTFFSLSAELICKLLPNEAL